MRQKIADRANSICEYCRISEKLTSLVFQIDHIRSIKHGGLNIFGNYAYCCPDCNSLKGTDVGTFSAIDAEILVRFFNPRKDIWVNHFEIFEE